MRRRARIAGLLLTAALSSGCVGADARRDRPSPEQLAVRRELSQQAQAAIDRGDWAQARAGLIRLVSEDPDSAEVYHRLGRVFTAQGDLARAEAVYRKALQLDPEYADALCGLGQVEARLGRLAEGLEHIESAVEIDPQRAENHLAQGRVLEALGRTDDALAAYFRALGVDSASSEALVRIGAIQLRRKQHDQALARLTHALELTPDDPEIRFHRGRANLALGHVPEAVEDLRAAAAKLPGRSDVFCALALALEQAQRPADALEAARRALTLAPGSPDARTLTDRLRR